MAEIDLSKTPLQDNVAGMLRNAAHMILIGVFGLLPLIFVPFSSVALEYTKVLVVVCGIAVALIVFSLSVLRSGTISAYLPVAFWIFWGVVLASVASAFLSGDVSDALIGNVFGIHTAAFVALLGFTMTVWMCVGISKTAVMRLYTVLMASTFILALFHLLRIVVGTDFLSLGVFMNTVSTPIGGWNDLGLFLGLTILLALVTFEQLQLSQLHKILFGFVVAVSLLILMIINFFFIWVILGIVSLVMVVYALGKDRFIETTRAAKKETKALKMPVIPAIVAVVSIVFILAGGPLGGAITKYTGISYTEVRPSVIATAGIAKAVYSENALLGIGTNKFSDAWRLYKDPAINQTIFWNTEFQAASGYIPTFFITTGILGGLLWIAFLIGFLFVGGRMLLKTQNPDPVWYFVGTSSFVGAAFIWCMSLLYIPGTVVLLIGALFTALTFIAQGALAPEKMTSLVLSINKRTGFVLTLAVMVIIIASLGAMYGIGRHYAAVYAFTESEASVKPGVELDSVEQQIAKAYALLPNDNFARKIAEYQLARMNTLLNVQQPTELQQQQFQTAISNGVAAAQLATEGDAQEPENWAVLGRIYSVLVLAQLDQSYERSHEALTKAQELDPKNPLRYLDLAQLEGRKGNQDEATRLVKEAIRLKPNYSDGLFFLSQLDIAKGDVTAAIDSTRSMIQIEPQNPSRYYQLGVLEASQKNYDVAIPAFEAAIRLDDNYANARYFLALAYSEKGRKDDARMQLEKVLELNPGNDLILRNLAELNSTGKIDIEGNGGSQQIESVQDGTSTSESSDDVTTTETSDTPLVSPVNTQATDTNEETAPVVEESDAQ